VDWGTLWYIGAHFPRGGDRYGIPWFQSLSTPTVNVLYFVLFLLCCLGIGLVALLAPRRPRFGQLAFLVIAAFLITGKVWSQQYVLWVLPLAVLARPRWGAFLAWQVAEVGYFLAFYGELIGASPGGKAVFTEAVFVWASVARLATLAVLCGFVIRDIMRPSKDVVRQYGDDDPDGGEFEGTPDASFLGALRGEGRGPVTATARTG